MSRHSHLGFAMILLLALGGVVWVGTLLAKEPSKTPKTEGENMAHHEGERKNRLAGESSPYLLLHQYNPVDWYPWGEEALEKARRENKPIFLSVGYSTCYWCHVMERESFSNAEIAALLNEGFVPIKVDREERPDLDEIYMTATQILTRHGGWPNSVFLTPELVPFFAGTYFPPEDRQGRPGFGTVLRSLEDAWKNRRPEVEQSAAKIADVMRKYLEERAEPTAAPPSPAVADRSMEALARRFDETWGGFGNAPKFPTPSNLYLPLELAASNDRAGEMLSASLDHMARGGIYDQLAGGFHRYSTDRQWLVPHFEKMLYDNGFLLDVFAREYQRTRNPEAARIVRETASFLEREMTSPEGALWSAIDAETDGHEGAYYVWKREELVEILGQKDADFLAAIYGFGGAPNFEGEYFVLHLPETVESQAARLEMSRDELLKRLTPLKKKILDARWKRDRPLTDDKVLTDWNGIAIAGLATAGRVLEEPSLTRQAERAALFVLAEMRKGSVLQHSWREGKAKIDAYLSDYAFLVQGLLALHEATGKESWLAAAKELTKEQIQRLRDTGGGYFVAAKHPDLLFRSKDVLDGAMPSPNAVAVLNLIELADKTGEDHWRREAAASLKTFGGMLESTPEGLRMMSVAARRFGSGSEAASEEGVDSTSRARVGNPLLAEAENAVAVTAEVGPSQDGWRAFRLLITMAPGWHVNANPASQQFLIPTEIKGEELEVRDLRYPEGSSLQATYAEGDLRVYEGEVEVRGEIAGPAGEGPTILLLTYQACDQDRCLPPVTKQVPI